MVSPSTTLVLSQDESMLVPVVDMNDICPTGTRHLLPLMNSFNKTEAAVFSFRPCFLRASLSSVYYNNRYHFTIFVVMIM